MRCVFLISKKESVINQQIIQWFTQFDNVSIECCHKLSCVTEAATYDKVIIAFDHDKIFNKVMLQTVEYLNNVNIEPMVFLINNPILPASFHYFFSDKKPIDINSKKNISNQLFGYEHIFC